MSELVVCSRCIFDSKTPGIVFDSEGVCNYCRQVDALKAQYQTGTPQGEEYLNEKIEQIKRVGQRKKYDCVIGVSGGTDSSYLLIKALEWGLRPLAVHYDNTWNSAIATENIRKVTSDLDVDLYTYVIDNKEADDIFRAFFLSGVPEFDASTDIAFVQVLRSAAAKYGVKYILEGHSFVAEGVSPMGKNYFDGKYIESIHKQYGKKPLKTYPNLTFGRFLKWTVLHRQTFLRPLWYIAYSKQDAREILEKQTSWEYYGGHHLENRATAFLHTYYNPKKFGIDNRNWTLAADAREGRLSREEALEIYRTPTEPDEELVRYAKRRMGLTDDEFEAAMNGPQRSFRDFATYKERFERWRPIFALMEKRGLVTTSFYKKYCFPLDEH